MTVLEWFSRRNGRRRTKPRLFIRHFDADRDELTDGLRALAHFSSSDDPGGVAREINWYFDGCEARRTRASGFSAGPLGCTAVIIIVSFIVSTTLGVVVLLGAILLWVLAGILTALAALVRWYDDWAEKRTHYLRVVRPPEGARIPPDEARGLATVSDTNYSPRFIPKVVFYVAVKDRLVLARALPNSWDAAREVSEEALRQLRVVVQAENETLAAQEEAVRAADALQKLEARRANSEQER